MNFNTLLKRVRYFCVPRQLIYVMKITTILLLVSVMTVSASSFAQKITLKQNKATLEQVLKEIRLQSGYDLIYSDQLLARSTSISINLKNATLEEALSACLEGQPLSYQIQDGTVILKAKELSLFDKIKRFVNTIDVRGRVLDENGHPVVGANVRLKDGTQLVMTDRDGYFDLKNVDEKAFIVITSMGFNRLEIPISADMTNIRLTVSSSKLDEVQVMAYGTTTKRLSTGAITKITNEQIASNPSSNPILSIAGRAAGVTITENSGAAGASFTINIRGQNTINAGKLPLYIVDGVPFEGKAIEQSAGSYVGSPPTVGSGGFNPLNVLSPNMIEGIEILKDADATALYGSRAANGVVVITTKKGKAGGAKVDASVNSGVTSVTRKLPMLNAEQYIAMRSKAFANDGITPTATNAPDLVSFEKGWDTDFQDYFYNKGHFNNATLDLSGGSAETLYMLSANYRRESPVFDGNFSDKVARVKLNVQHNSVDKRFKLNASASYGTDQNLIPLFNAYNTFNLPPNLPLYKNDGKLAWYTGFTNPLSLMINTNEQSTNDLLGNLSLSYQIIDGLTFKTDAGYHKTDVDNTYVTRIASKNPSSASAANGTVYRNYSNTELYTIEPQLNYMRTIAKGQLQALLGGTYQYSNAVQPAYYSGTFTSDALYQDMGSLTITQKTSAYSERKYTSLFGRLNYVWDSKYIINGNYRRDGSSVFAPGNRFGNFGSVGAGWIISEEDFLKNNAGWLSFLKLRTSYGSIGNDQIPAYGYLSYYVPSFFGYAGANAINPARVGNDNNFSWEVTKKFDVSVDLGIFKDRVLFTANYFRNLTSNMLLTSVPLASQSGFFGYTGNVPGLKVENKGLELELNTVNIASKDFKWNTSFNITFSKNKLLEFPGLAASAFATGGTYRTGTDPGYVIGQSLNPLFGYELVKIENGVTQVKDQDGDGKITAGLFENGKGDYVMLGSSDPKFYGGFANTFTYKNFQLDILFQFVKKQNYNIYHGMNVAPGGLNASFGVANQPADILNLPFTYSALASSAAYSSFVNYYALSDATVSDASYIRLKNVSLSYTLPNKWTNSLKIRSAGIFMRGQNLLTITKYKGFDPETFGTTLPLYKTISFGLQISF